MPHGPSVICCCVSETVNPDYLSSHPFLIQVMQTSSFLESFDFDYENYLRHPYLQGEDHYFMEVDYDPDPNYAMFLEHLRPDRNSYVFEATNVEDGSSTFVKYDGDEIGFETKASSDSHTSQGRRCFMKGEDCDHSLEVDGDPDYEMFLKHLRVDDKSYAFETINEDGLPVFVKYEGRVGPDGSDSVTQSFARGNTTSIGRNSHAAKTKRTKGSSRPKSGKAFRPCSLSVSQEVEHPYVDEAYQDFLSHLRLCDGSMIFEMHNGISVKYQDYNQAGIQEHGFVDIVRDDLTNSNASYFEKQLMAIIMKPFDQNEYEHLLNMVTSQRPVERLRHLRGGTKSYETKKMGRSFLDHHPDVAEHIKFADRRRGLTLLRAFIFWLKNLSHIGAFKPWKSQALTECQSPELRRFLQTALALD